MSGSCRKTMQRSEARSRRSGSGNGAGSGGYRNRLERGADFRRSHDLDACYSVLCLRCRIFDVRHVGCIVCFVFVAVHYPPAFNKQVEWIMHAVHYPGWLMHSRRSGESAFTEKGCTLLRLKGAWHRAVMDTTVTSLIGQNLVPAIRSMTGTFQRNNVLVHRAQRSRDTAKRFVQT